jgi:membrane protein insertase Oxa1/YidC/SpoIIIJ
MPAITVFIGLTLPGGLTLYWFVLTLLTILQQVIIFRSSSKKEIEIVD